jgi:hypothetical protein
MKSSRTERERCAAELSAVDRNIEQIRSTGRVRVHERSKNARSEG